MLSSLRSKSAQLSRTAGYFYMSTEHLLYKQDGALGTVILNRPKALNALTPEMCADMTDVMKQFVQEGEVKAFIVKGEGGRAFCAGGDVRAVYDEISASDESELGKGREGMLSSDFFRVEYQMNYLMSTCPVPQISIWDGIVMGGGVGISVHGQYRICTDNTMLAMPETGIGLFPDVGTTHTLAQLRDGLGSYIGCTGVRLNARDCMYSGLATHYIPQDCIESGELEEKLSLLLNGDSGYDIDEVLCSFPPMNLDDFEDNLAHMRYITSNYFKPHDHFRSSPPLTAAQLFDNLRTLSASSSGEMKDRADKVLGILEKMSPTSISITLKAIALAQKNNDSLEECLKREFIMTQGSARKHSDFQEGVRALLVDKDRNPQWNPASVHDLDEQLLDDIFFNPANLDRELELTRWDQSSSL
jgi:enoyl-CoA hydratase/carnithine racemase